jgi:hypothetical protein
MCAALSNDLSLKMTIGNIITLASASRISTHEMDKALDIIEEFIAEVEKAS